MTSQNGVCCFCRVRFTVVSEPPEGNEDGECEDVGVSFVSVRDILNNSKDVIDEDIPSKCQLLFSDFSQLNNLIQCKTVKY